MPIKSAEQRLHERVTGTTIDMLRRSFVGMAQAGDLRLPLLQPQKMIREERSDRDWSFSAGVTHRRRRDHTAEEVAAIRAGREVECTSQG